ncbi:MAG: AP2 domain-containing protein [Pseudomonadota bacterium]
MTVEDKSPEDLLHITRNGKTWMVRIWDSRIQGYHAANVNDADYGPVSPETSLREAQAWRDKTIAQHGIQTTHDRNGAYAVYSLNASGVVGVSLEYDRRGRPAAWRAYRGSVDDGDRERFSIRRHGYEGAFCLAVQARHRMMGLPAPEPMPDPPRMVVRPNRLPPKTDPRESFVGPVRTVSYVTGVSLQRGRNGHPQALLANCGHERRRFSIAKHGHEGAYRMAVEARRAMEIGKGAAPSAPAG